MTRRAALLGLGALGASSNILNVPAPKADARVAYGADALQFADLRLPHGKGPHPVVIYVHGGFWKAAYSLEHAGHACSALTRAGAATWSLEYRRIGDSGGGWPGTFDDVRAGALYLKRIAREHDLDLERVVVAGHSAGGHLALWLAAQNAATLRGAISLAGVADLRRAWELRLSDGIVGKLLGGSPDQQPERYAKADPIELLPITVQQRLVHGTDDAIVPFEISQRFAKASRNAELIPVRNAGHFELIDPHTSAWKIVEKAVMEWISV